MKGNGPETVAIIGAGIGGVYLLAELGTAGFKLRLHDIDDLKLAEIRARGGLEVESKRVEFAAVDRATTDLAAAIDVAEMDNYPYSSWRLSPTRVRLIVRKRWLQLATFPGNRIGTVFPRLSPLFPEAFPAPNILYTGFTNANAMLHVANCVANAGRIESGDSYKFYAEGVTPAVARLYEAINAERVAVAAVLGASVPTLADWFDRVYGVREATLVETCQRLTYNSDGPYQATGTPKSLDHKFITEDVPTGLIPMSAIGAAAGVKTPAIDALVEMVRNMTGKDFAAEGRTLEGLGLRGMDAERIRRTMEEGFS